MDNLKVNFDVLDDRAKILVGHSKASSHLAFYARMTLERKDLIIKDGNKTSEP